jgi:predicted nuclease of predicted toxin-antitoxin system
VTTSPRFLADHDFNEHIPAGCNRLEPLVEFVRARHAGLRHAADGNILQYAEAHGLCVVSHDVNTMTAAAKARLERGQSFPSLFLVRQTVPVRVAIESILLVWSSSCQQEWRNLVALLPF